VLDPETSSELDAVFDFSVTATPPAPTSEPQYRSRRDLRKAEGARPRVTARATAGRKLNRHDMAALRASAGKQPRKNPLAVLLTMAAVGGMFVVAGLPAYSQTTQAGSPWITDAGSQSVSVSAEALTGGATRDDFRATTPDQLKQITANALRAQANAAYLASGARAMGDDYPWPFELMDYQGGGLSPLHYYYRECVDFVAWRVNRDAGSYSAPFKWTWSNLTPLGGNGRQWMNNWQHHGWPVSKTPVVGAVAYVGGNHLAYVKTVNADGTVLLEEYNYVPGAYSQRTIPASSIVAFLYPPPA
jgi:hypothetical protein